MVNGLLMWSDDPWFQPVDLALEADGSLLAADWYDGNINYQRTYRNRDNFDSRRGRIYRISASGKRPPQNSEQSPKELFHDRNQTKCEPISGVECRRLHPTL